MWNITRDRPRLPRQRPLFPPTEPRLAVLYALTNFPRLLLLTYLPILSIQLLHDAQSVSVLYLTSSAGAVVATVVMPKMLQHLSARSAFVAISLIATSCYLLFALYSVPTLFAALFLFVICSSAYEILLNLFALENLSRTQQSRYEPLRITFSIFGFVCGPAVGILLGTSISPTAPFFIAIAFTTIAVIFFLTIEIKMNRAPKRDLPNPFGHLKRYVAQPRLRLAYVLASGRAAWWQMFFVYSPITLLELGYSEKLAGAIGSIALAMTVTTPMWASLSRKIGVRRLVVIGFTASGLCLVLVGALHGDRSLVLALLILAAFWATSLDGVGNIFFLRAVHPYERIEMASVFSTFRDVGQATPPLVVAPLARLFELPMIFGLWGVFLLGFAFLGRRLPKGL